MNATDVQVLQSEWRDLKRRLDAILDESEGVSIYDERANELIYGARQIRYRISELAQIVTYVENDEDIRT